jgi:phosphohistidine phosphatase
MIVYLMRHGIAEDQAPLGRDADRELTREGTLRTAMVAKGLHRLGLTFDRIVSSPYVRARQTAEIVARVVGYETDLVFDERLVPHARFDDLNDMIRENSDAASLLLAGHEPSMSGFISGLCADGRLRIDVRKASVTAIEINAFSPRASGMLLWSLPPKLVEGLAK